MKTGQKIECSIIMVDISGFTQLLYQSSHNEQAMELVTKSIRTMFLKSMVPTKRMSGIRVINTTGDGFIAISIGRTRTKTAMTFAELIQIGFEKYVKPILNAVPFRQKIDLRIALHHGSIYKIEVPWEDEIHPVFVGDDINLAARVIDSQTARRYTFAITQSFYRKLMRTSKTPVPDEIILDRNKYPEEIEVFQLPDYKHAGK